MNMGIIVMMVINYLHRFICIMLMFFLFAVSIYIDVSNEDPMRVLRVCLRQEENNELFLKEIKRNPDVSALVYNMTQDSLSIIQQGYYDENALRIGLKEINFLHNSDSYVYIYSKIDADTTFISVFPQSIFYREVFEKYQFRFILRCCIAVSLSDNLCK